MLVTLYIFFIFQSEWHFINRLVHETLFVLLILTILRIGLSPRK